MMEAEPAIRQLLKLDFEPKVSETIRKNFRQVINQTLKTLLLPMADKQTDVILQQYSHARNYLQQTLEKEAEDKILSNQRLLSEVEQKIEIYNHAINAINSNLQMMGLYEHLLPVINDVDEVMDVVNHEIIDTTLVNNDVNNQLLNN